VTAKAPKSAPKVPVPQRERPRSRGAVLLARTGCSKQQISDAIAVSYTLVGFWLAGSRVPANDKRQSLAREYGIPVDAWEEPALAVAMTGALEALPKVTDEDIDRASAKAFMLAVRTLDVVDTVDNAAARVKLSGEAIRQLDHSARLHGVSMNLSEAKAVRHPAFRRVWARIVDALARHPEALAEVKAAIAARGPADRAPDSEHTGEAVECEDELRRTQTATLAHGVREGHSHA